MIYKSEEEISDQFNHLKVIGISFFLFFGGNSAKNDFLGIFPAQGGLSFSFSAVKMPFLLGLNLFLRTSKCQINNNLFSPTRRC